MLLADGGVLATVEDGAGDDIHLAVFLGPATALHLHLVPVSGVEAVVLRTHIRHQEALVHGLLVPTVVSGGAHVATVVARLHIVVGRHAVRLRHFVVGMELHALALNVTVGVCCDELPRYPVGHERGVVERADVGLAPEQLLRHALLGEGQKRVGYGVGRVTC